MSPTDPVELTAALIRCPSVTPEEGGALTLLGDLLAASGFEVHRVDRGGVPNLFARWGRKGARTLGFNGHTDVVPPGDPASWTHPPFSGHREGGTLWGRGATDMKSGVAAFAAAAIDFTRTTPPDDGAIILTITGDEEALGEDGTRALLDWMTGQGEAMDHCIVGEPTCIEAFGDMMKIGRRGSLSLHVEARGVQGHSAYPHRARNPIHALITLLAGLTAQPLDAGTEHFEPSTLQVVSVDVGNPASNVIPETARAVINIRFNDAHDGAGLIDRITRQADRIAASSGVALQITPRISGESFLTAPGRFVDLVREAVQDVTGVEPVLSTSGGTSDARFVKDHCPVVEFGLVGRYMHQIDERVPESEIIALTAAYSAILKRYFA